MKYTGQDLLEAEQDLMDTLTTHAHAEIDLVHSQSWLKKTEVWVEKRRRHLDEVKNNLE